MQQTPDKRPGTCIGCYTVYRHNSRLLFIAQPGKIRIRQVESTWPGAAVKTAAGANAVYLFTAVAVGSRKWTNGLHKQAGTLSTLDNTVYNTISLQPSAATQDHYQLNSRTSCIALVNTLIHLHQIRSSVLQTSRNCSQCRRQS